MSSHDGSSKKGSNRKKPKFFKKSPSLKLITNFNLKKQMENEEISSPHISEARIEEEKVEEKRDSLYLNPEIKALKNITPFNDQSSSKKHSLQIPNSERLSKFSKLGENLSKFNQNIKKEKKKTFYDVITDFYLTKKFIKVLQISTIRRPKFLSENHFNLIGDKSFDFFSFKKQQIFNPNVSVMSMTQNSLGKIWRFNFELKAFHPFSKGILLWNIFHLIIFLGCFIMIPINFCFEMNFLQDVLSFSQEIKII